MYVHVCALKSVLAMYFSHVQSASAAEGVPAYILRLWVSVYPSFMLYSCHLERLSYLIYLLFQDPSVLLFLPFCTVLIELAENSKITGDSDHSHEI